MRTSEQFSKVWDELKWWVGFHKKPVWLCAHENGYYLSVIKPEPQGLPAGTAANFYDVDLKIIDTVKSSKMFS